MPADPNSEHNMDFSAALLALKDGNAVSRSGWNGKGMWIIIHDPEDSLVVSEVGQPDIYYEMPRFIGMKTADDKFIPWLASQTDILADDWGIVE